MNAMNAGPAERVRDLLDRHQMRNHDLAARLGISDDKLSKSLRGNREFATGELADIADVFDVDIYWLISGEAHRRSPLLSHRHTYDHETGAHVAPTGPMATEIDSLARAYTQAELDTSESDGLFDAFVQRVGASGVDRTAANPWTGMRAVADVVRAEWLRYCDGRDPVLTMGDFLAERIGIDLVVLDGGAGSGAVEAHSLKAGGCRSIAIGQTAAWYSAVFGILHELGHHLFDDLAPKGDEGLTDRPVSAEALVNGFAANVVLPKPVLESVPVESSLEHLAETLWDTCAGVSSFRHRCSTIGLDRAVPWNQADVTKSWEETHPDGQRSRAELWRAPSFPERLITRHEQLVESAEVPPDSLAWMLQVPVEDVEPMPSVHHDSADGREVLELLGIDA